MIGSKKGERIIERQDSKEGHTNSCDYQSQEAVINKGGNHCGKSHPAKGEWNNQDPDT
jgi:hypothetical protein